MVGEIETLEYLGHEEPNGDESFPAAVFSLRYRTAAAGGATLFAKFYVPLGPAPSGGWPVSVWAHGLGDPANDFHRWPFVGENWRKTRGRLAGRWAQHGIATLIPWLPGAGPSEPLGTFSPMSLERNARAIVDSCAALAAASERLQYGGPTGAGKLSRLDLSRLVLRAECVSTAALVRLAAEWRSHEALAGLRALVADDFQASHAYNAYYLNQPSCKVSGVIAAAVWSLWVRVRWSQAMVEGWPLSTFFNQPAIDLLSPDVPLPIGSRSRIYGLSLTRSDRPSIAALLLEAVSQATGRSPRGDEIRDWLYAPEMVRWMSLPTLAELVGDPFYRQYSAASDPYFAENIAPFEPGIPLLVVGRSDQTPVAGMPSLAERHQHMTLPRVRTLTSWGWDVQMYEAQVDGGTSFTAGPAQQWTLARVAELLRKPVPA